MKATSVIDCPTAIDVGLRELADRALLKEQARAEQRARMVRAVGPVRAPSVQQRRHLAEMADRMRAQCTPAGAAAQWAELGASERLVLVLFAGLREMSPGESVRSISEREWYEFVPAERSAIGEAVRVLLRRLGALHGIARGRW